MFAWNPRFSHHLICPQTFRTLTVKLTRNFLPLITDCPQTFRPLQMAAFWPFAKFRPLPQKFLFFRNFWWWISSGGQRRATFCSQCLSLLQPICTPRKCTPSSVWMSISSSQGIGSRLPDSGLEQVEDHLPLPASSPHPRVPAKASRIRWPRHFRGSMLTSCSLVARTPCKRLPAQPPPSGLPVRVWRLTHCSRGDVLALSRLQFLKKAFKVRLPQQVAQSLTQAHRSSTRSQYETCWKSFQQWLQQQPAVKVSKGLTLSFLHFLSSSKGLNPKTVLVYSNALHGLHLPLLHGFNINTQDNEFACSQGLSFSD